MPVNGISRHCLRSSSHFLIRYCGLGSSGNVYHRSLPSSPSRVVTPSTFSSNRDCSALVWTIVALEVDISQAKNMVCTRTKRVELLLAKAKRLEERLQSKGMIWGTDPVSIVFIGSGPPEKTDWEYCGGFPWE